MWWIVGGAVGWFLGATVIAGAVMRLVSGRKPGRLDQSEKVQRAFAAVHRGRPVAIASAQEGPVLIRGKVAARQERLASPLTQRGYLYYDLRVDDLGHLSPVTREQRFVVGPGVPTTAVLHQRDAHPFLITDETGTALIAFDGLDEVMFVVPEQVSLTGRKLREATDVHQALFELGVAPAGPIAVQEAAIFVGDEVTVAGVGRREATPDGEPDGLRGPPMRYVVRAAPDGLLGILRRKRRS